MMAPNQMLTKEHVTIWSMFLFFHLLHLTSFQFFCEEWKEAPLLETGMAPLGSSVVNNVSLLNDITDTT